MKVLIIDDNPADRRIVGYYFTSHGWTTEEAADGAEAIDIIRKGPPSLIISDALMPNLDGFQFLHELKKSPFCNIPVVIYTANYKDETEQELALALGADGYMIKPKDPFQFWEELEGILAERRKGKHREIISDDEEYLRRYTAVLMRKLGEKVRELESQKGTEAEGRLSGEIEDGRRRIEEARKLDSELLRRVVRPATPLSAPGQLLSSTAAREHFFEPLREMEKWNILLLEREGARLPFEAVQQLRHIHASIRLMGSVLQDLLRVPGISRSKLHAPLRRVEVLAQVLEEDHGDALDAGALEALEGVRKAKERMAVMIDDVLELMRIQQVEIIKEQVDLSAIVETVARDLKAADPERQVQISVQNGVTVAGDRHLLVVVMENLLDNAWKFTLPQEQPRIEFNMDDEDGERMFCVRDNGVGFDPEQSKGLFSPFVRLHRMEDFPGTGIGLATVRNIVERHGGRCWAIGAPGAGATFCFTLD